MTDGQTYTDRQTSCHCIVRAMRTRRAVKTRFYDWVKVRLQPCNTGLSYRTYACRLSVALQLEDAAA